MGIIRDRWRQYENDQLLLRAQALGLGGGGAAPYDAAKTYKAGEQAVAGGHIWRALVGTTGIAPAEGATWTRLLAGVTSADATDAELASAIAAAGGFVVATFTATDPLVVASGTRRIYNDTGRTLTIQSVRASLGTVGTSVTTVDVNKDGTTLFTTQTARPSLASGIAATTGTPAVTSWESGSYLTVDVDAVGTSAAALVVQVTAK